jgi:hypothetical protein
VISRYPVEVVEDDLSRGGQIQSNTPCLYIGYKDAHATVRLKAVHLTQV